MRVWTTFVAWLSECPGELVSWAGLHVLGSWDRFYWKEWKSRVPLRGGWIGAVGYSCNPEGTPQSSLSHKKALKPNFPQPMGFLLCFAEDRQGSTPVIVIPVLQVLGTAAVALGALATAYCVIELL